MFCIQYYTIYSWQDSDLSLFLFTFPPFSLTLAYSLQLSLSFWNHIKTPTTWLAKVRQLWPVSPLSLLCALFTFWLLNFDLSCCLSTCNLLPVCSCSCPCLNPCRSFHITLNIDTFLPAVEQFNTHHPALFHALLYALGFRHVLILLPYAFPFWTLGWTSHLPFRAHLGTMNHRPIMTMPSENSGLKSSMKLKHHSNILAFHMLVRDTRQYILIVQRPF